MRQLLWIGINNKPRKIMVQYSWCYFDLDINGLYISVPHDAPISDDTEEGLPDAAIRKAILETKYCAYNRDCRVPGRRFARLAFI